MRPRPAAVINIFVEQSGLNMVELRGTLSECCRSNK